MVRTGGQVGGGGNRYEIIMDYVSLKKVYRIP